MLEQNDREIRDANLRSTSSPCSSTDSSHLLTEIKITEVFSGMSASNFPNIKTSQNSSTNIADTATGNLLNNFTFNSSNLPSSFERVTGKSLAQRQSDGVILIVPVNLHTEIKLNKLKQIKPKVKVEKILVSKPNTNISKHAVSDSVQIEADKVSSTSGRNADCALFKIKEKSVIHSFDTSTENVSYLSFEDLKNKTIRDIKLENHSQLLRVPRDIGYTPISDEGTLSETSLNTITPKIHRPSKLLKCDKCGRSFAYAASLSIHQAQHSEYEYECDRCEEKFNTKAERSAHKRRHCAFKTQQCTFCNKWSNSLCSLKQHLRCHTGEKPYDCSVCNESFRTHCMYKNHMLHHERKLYAS